MKTPSKTFNDLSRWEQEILFFKKGTAGGFYTKLVLAFQHADLSNSIKLLQAFPEELGPWNRLRIDDSYSQELDDIFSKY